MPKPSFSLFIERYAHRLVLAIFLALAAWVYWPSLGHVVRADQVSYLADVSADDRPLSLIFGRYDFNRTRIFSPGDEIQFRPILFIFLGLERAVFGYHYWMWQLTGIILHLLVVFSLYRLLRLFRPGMPAAVTAGGFSVLFSNMEGVIWHHINGYLIFAALILLAFERLYRYASRPGKEMRYLLQSVAVFTVAAFIHELGFIFTALMTLFVLWTSPRGLRRRAWLLFVPVLAYVILSSADFFLKHIQYTEGGNIYHAFNLGKTLEHVAQTFKWFVTAGFFLLPSDIEPISRMRVQESVFGLGWPGVTGTRVEGWVTVGVLIAAFVGASMPRGPKVALPRKFALLMLLLAMVYPAVFTVGRVDTRGMYILQISLYYLYNFWVLMVVGAYAFIAGSGLVMHGWVKGVALTVGILVCATFIGRNAIDLRRMNSNIAKDHTACRVLLENLDRFVQAHKKEPGFSFYIPLSAGNYAIDWTSRRDDPPGKVYALVELLYLPYYTRYHPKYIIQTR